MKICVYGLWHLGCVTAACLADSGHQIIGLDADKILIEKLSKGLPPIMEPGLEKLLKSCLSSGKLSFTTDIESALDSAEIIWVTYDTPVDENDKADIDFVLDQVEHIFPFVTDQSLILISSQLPVGSTRTLEKRFIRKFPTKKIGFAYSPENLRLGKAIQAFVTPKRIVVGCDDVETKHLIKQIFYPFSSRIEWMSVESAEMTKHALNAFLATSVSFINEIGSLCERIGADAKEVERGLKSDPRIGEKAYLSPGSAFSGGTLARDIQLLIGLGDKEGAPVHLLNGVAKSNDVHSQWAVNVLKRVLGDVSGKKVAVWGLTYKAGTDTLRRSGAIDMCKELSSQNAEIHAFDPAIHSIPKDLRKFIHLHQTAEETLLDADALVIYTGWDQLKTIEINTIISRMNKAIVLDANRFLANQLDSNIQVQYLATGKGEYFA